LLWNFSIEAGTLVDFRHALASAPLSVPEVGQTIWEAEGGIWLVISAVPTLIAHAAAFIEVPSLVLWALLGKALARTSGVVPHEVFW
jgi:hypothetical protein